MGTFVELQCTSGTVVKGEGFLSCIDSGIWDFPVPECVPIQMNSTTTEPNPVHTTTTAAAAASTSTSATTTAATTTKKPVIYQIPEKHSKTRKGRK